MGLERDGRGNQRCLAIQSGPTLPAIVMVTQAPLPVGIFQSVVGMLESLVPEQAWLPALQRCPVLCSPVIRTIGCETL